MTTHRPQQNHRDPANRLDAGIKGDAGQSRSAYRPIDRSLEAERGRARQKLATQLFLLARETMPVPFLPCLSFPLGPPSLAVGLRVARPCRWASCPATTDAIQAPRPVNLAASMTARRYALCQCSKVRGRCARSASSRNCGSHRGRRSRTEALESPTSSAWALTINRFDQVVRARRFQ